MNKDNRTKITFSYEGKDYTLVYSADSLKKMERKYKISFVGIEDRVFTAVEDLFIGAFIANHDNVPVDTRTKIYAALCSEEDESKEMLGDVLLKMVNEALEEINPKDNKGNLKWKVERKD